MPTPASRIPFPIKGLNLTAGYRDQPAGTSNDVLNVRPFDAIEGRLRGGRRPGLSKWVDEAVLIDQPIQAMVPIVKAAAYEESTTTYDNEYVVAGYEDRTDLRLRFYRYSDGALLGSYDVSDSSTGARVSDTATDDAGNVYVALRDRSNQWTGSLGAYAQILKIRPDGTIAWTKDTFYDATDGEGTADPAIAYDPVYNRVITAGYRGNYVTDGRVVFVYDAETGDEVWTWGGDYPDGLYGDDPVVDTDALGNVFVAIGTIGYPDATNTGRGMVLKLSPTGVVLADWFTQSNGEDINELASGLAVKSDGTVAVTLPKTSDTFDGYVATAANVFVLSNDLSSVDYVYEMHNDTSSPYGGVRCAWHTDGDLLVYGNRELAPSTHTLTKFNAATGTVDWRFYDGNTFGAAEHNIAVGVDGSVAICAANDNTAWDGAGGNAASIWLLDDSGSVTWYLDQTNSSGISTLHVEAESTATTEAETRETALLVAVAGSIRTVKDSTISTPTGGINVLTTKAGRIQATTAYGDAFFVDGDNNVKYDFSTDTVSTWTAATAGTLPSGARLISRYRGRIVLSGVPTDAHNWFMSKQGDPEDWDYAPATPTAQDAVAGNNSLAGEVGDVITALMPFNDDLMWFGCNGSIWQMTGDPLAGGAIDLISDQTGMSFGASWAKDPNNAVYFHGIDGIYKMVPNAVPESITNGRLDEVFRDLDRTTNRVKLTWNYLEKQLWVLISPLDGTTQPTVYVYDTRTDSWWKDLYPSSMGPEVLLSYDAEVGNDEAFLLGCRDGYIRKQDRTATGDDGTAITSRVRLEPILSADLERMVRLTGMSFGLVEGSGAVDIRLYQAQTPEQLADATAVRFKRTLTAGHNGPSLPRLEGGALGLELYADALASPWAVEDMGIRTAVGGRLRRHRR
jgi:hypothetical protein